MGFRKTRNTYSSREGNISLIALDCDMLKTKHCEGETRFQLILLKSMLNIE